ncbi:MAG: UDP-N-acetylglucosamine--N-acetylmuramyl-(pentapeptide) pyrophosphoryl-undecaprenol N-acetylglucosamine transferase, partial [Candidatus Eremiobacteraeota bacterium]|nr:UDP-N-acetylglucosamine--N-acetylmuramyl-(pentapeptide) pyrophosphoryl-undecaprenol N-acetylglucosamine transferase [Candidatus Eremiobacteraeota bacterium]
ALYTAMGIIPALVKISRSRPDLIIGLGGYVSVPAVIAGRILGIPVLLMEQNRVPGRATRFLAGMAKTIVVSFPDSEKYLAGKNVVYTGNPVRKKIISASREESRRKLGIGKSTFCLLITGASQGARSINRSILLALERWKDKPWIIIHLTGKKEYEQVKSEAEDILRSPHRIDYRPKAYMENIHEAYAAADLVLARAGATTLAEITARGLPAILVPYPYATGAHQEENARLLESAGGGVVLRDDELIASLPETVEKIASDPERLDKMKQNSMKIGKPDALQLVMAEINRLLGIDERSI